MSVIDLITKTGQKIDSITTSNGKPVGRAMVILDGNVVRINNLDYCFAYAGDSNDQDTQSKKSASGYARQDQIAELTTESVTIPQNFAGLEAEMIPTRLQYQLFRIVEVVENEDYVTVTARHVWYDNLDNYTLWEAAENTDYTGAAMCRNVLANTISPVISRVASDCTDALPGSDMDYTRKNIVECFLDPEKGICAKYGLSLIRDNWDFYCLKEVGYDRGLVIENGKNLLGVERKESIENVITRVAPIGKDAEGNLVWLNYNGNKYIDSQYIEDYSSPRTEIYDTKLQIGKDDVTAENIQAKLLEAAQKRFSEDKVDLPELEMTIEFLSIGDTEEYIQYRGLDKVYLYDILTIKDTIRGYNYSAQVIGVEHDILTGRLNSVTIGNIKNADGSRKIATWQVPEVDGTNIRLKSILSGAFAEGAIQASDIGNGVISYAHFASATINDLTADSLTAVYANIHELIAGRITAEDIEAGSITADEIAAGAITADKIDAGAITAEKIDAGAITTEKLAAGAVTADKIDAGAITADKISAESITAAKIDTDDLNAINAKLGTASIARAEIQAADIGFLQVKDLDAQSAYFGQAVIQEGVAEKLFIPRLSVAYAQIVSATIGDLVIQATDGDFYKLDVDLDGKVTATQVTPTSQEIEDGHTADGRTIYLGTDIVAEDLNTTNIYASHALMDEITANIINVDKLFAREATIGKINALDLSSNTYIQSTVGNWQSQSTITQTVNSISSRIADLGYGTIYYSTTEPSHSGLVQGDIWVQPLDDHTWEEINAETWQQILDGGTWGSTMGAYKVYTWSGQYWKLMFDSMINVEMQTQIDQNAYAITLKADQTALNTVEGTVAEFGATLEVQAQEISAAVSAVNTKTSCYVMWADPRTAYTVSLGDIWVKSQNEFGSWLSAQSMTWQNLKANYTWGDALVADTYVWNGSEWIKTSDRATEIQQSTDITQTATSISLLAESSAKLQGEMISTKAALTVANDRITAEVQRATNAENGKIEKTGIYQTANAIVTEATRQAKRNADGSYIARTTTYQTADSIVTEAVSQANSTANGTYIKKTTTLQTADAIVTEATRQAKNQADGSYIKTTTTLQTADAIVNSAKSYTNDKLTDYSTTTQTATEISTYVGSHTYGIQSGIDIVAAGIEISGSKYIKIKSGGKFEVASGNFSIDTSGNVTISGAVTATSGAIAGWTISGTQLVSNGSMCGLEGHKTNDSTTAIWVGTAGPQTNSPFRVTYDGTVYLTKLRAVGEGGSYTDVNLSTAGLWKLNYHTVKSYTTSSLTLSNGAVVNFSMPTVTSVTVGTRITGTIYNVSCHSDRGTAASTADLQTAVSYGESIEASRYTHAGNYTLYWKSSGGTYYSLGNHDWYYK